MSQHGSLINRRTLPPRASQGVINRPRLTRISQKLMQHRLALVHAPAGSGKTTLLAQWHAALVESGVQTIWYSAGEDDSDPLGFADGLFRTLQLFAGDEGPSIPLADRPDTLAGLVVSLSHKASTQPVALFIDDYHLAEGGDGGETISRILYARIPQLTIVLASRVRPSLSTGRLRVSGEMIEVRVEDLFFNEAEAEDFFKIASPVPLSADESRQMREYAEGWAAGLRLTSLVLTRAPGALGDAVPTGGQRAFSDYFLQEVILGLPEKVHAFLRMTSILDTLSAELCNALTGRDDGVEMLTLLEEEQLFIVALPGSQRWYKYHHLFQEFLQERLYAEARTEIAELHCRAAQWFIDNGSPMDAVRHAFLARRPDWAAELIEGYCLYDYLSHGRFETFSRWMQQLPRESREERPLLLFLQVWRSINLRRFLQAEQTLRTIETAARDGASRMSAIARSIGLDVQGRLHLMRALVGAYGGDFASGFAHIEQLGERELDQLAFGQVDLDSIHSYLAFHRGDLDRAERLTWRANGVYDTIACHWGGIHSRCIAGLSYLTRGLVSEADDVLGDALRIAERNFGQHSYMVALPSALLGALAYNVGDIAEAERLWLLALPSEKATDVSGLCERVLIATIGLARLYDRTGRQDEGTALLMRASRRAYASEDFRLELQLAIERADRCFRLNAVTEARREWDRISLQLPEAKRRLPASAWQIWDAFKVVEARVLIDAGKSEAAIASLQVTVERARLEGRLLSAIQIERLIQQWQGVPSAQVLTAHRELRHLLDDYLQNVEIVASKSATSHRRQAESGNLREKLTEREFDVLKLIRSGLSNNEIAGKLNINLNTVKSHSKNLFSKLGVKSRTQAAMKFLGNDELED